MTEEFRDTRTAVIIEDDPEVRRMLEDVMTSAGFHTVGVDNGVDGIAAAKEHGALITTVDVNLPGIDGFEVARRLRAATDTYIVMLTALGEESDIVLGLSSGADDYITKPFRPRELRARLEALLRRPRRVVGGATDEVSDVTAASAAESEWLTHHDLRLDTSARVALLGDTEVVFTRSEFDLLAELLQSKRRVRTKTELALALRNELYGYSGASSVSDSEGRAIEAHMTNVRRKLDDDARSPRYIETVRGVGYRLTA